MFKYCSINDIGVLYKTNDDKLMINDVIVEEGSYKGETKDYISAILCDGVGGQAEGYRAALLTLQNLKGIVKENLTKDEVIEKIEEINTLIRKIQTDENKRNALKTTLVGIYSDDNILIYYNLGDSRNLTENEIKNYPKNIITNCIGYSDECRVNIYTSIGLVPNDIIFLCSDGVTDVIDDVTLKGIFDKKNSLEETLKEIHKLSLKNGSKDNISLILIKKEK